MDPMFSALTINIISVLALLFIFAVGIGLLVVIVLFVIDRTQRADAIRRNYPVLGRFRHLFTELGEFFRQYFFAMDREELPFNRAQRAWVSRAGEGAGNTVAFGSTRNLAAEGTPIFVNAAFPPLDEQAAKTAPLTIGPHARAPYDAPSIFNLSGMSFGAISKPAVQALSKGCKEAGIWMNTGEGGLSPYHLEGGCDIVFQMGTAKYGVRDAEGHLDDAKLREMAAYPQVKMIEIKLAQGAKPGKGGILLREVSGLPVGIKTVMGNGDAFADLFALINERGHDSAPDFITLDGGEGGTGASPMPLIDLVGVSIREALPLVARMRNEAGLRDRIKLIAGLVVEEKFSRVANYAKGIISEVEMIAHSVGVTEPRQMRRKHVRIVQSDGRSIPLDVLDERYNPLAAS